MSTVKRQNIALHNSLFIGGKVKLLTHVATHTGTKDHVCHTCGAGFIRPDSLRYHIQRVHEHNGRYGCMYCEYKTVRQEIEVLTRRAAQDH